jgi:hypothetical protein
MDSTISHPEPIIIAELDPIHKKPSAIEGLSRYFRGFGGTGELAHLHRLQCA